MTLTTELAEHVERLAAVDVEIDALKDSDAYRAGRPSTTCATKPAGSTARCATRGVTSTAPAASGIVPRMAGRARRTSRDLATDHHQRAIDALREVARAAAAEGLADEALVVEDDREGEALIHAWARARETVIAEIHGAVAAHDDAVRQRTFCERQLANDSEAFEARVMAERRAEDDRQTAVDEYIAAVTAWSAACSTIGADRVLARLPRPPQDPAEVENAVFRLGGDLIAEHHIEREGIERRRAEDEAERAMLDAEREVLAEGRIVEPAAPEWRSDRAGGAGAVARVGAAVASRRRGHRSRRPGDRFRGGRAGAGGDRRARSGARRGRPGRRLGQPDRRARPSRRDR